ncbi:hypothetical protein GCM10018962_38000 [Dactylosporangium matsuzakiense]|uniref:Uncharacterized protein n=2 Tax=Dactylosporangium matsuzakiense TaxID=53360 RepID=A0A9W6KKT5_9ACTN|nr:hypothetical protein GCM10017581_056020 [Dactylosporangium matsuzakiense]
MTAEHLHGKHSARRSVFAETVTEMRVVRRVPPARRAVTSRALGFYVFDDRLFEELDWYELIDPAEGDEHPAAAVAAVLQGGSKARLVGVAAPGGRSDLAVQVLIALVDSLRASPARRLVAAPGAHDEDVLRRAGFGPLDGSFAVEL